MMDKIPLMMQWVMAIIFPLQRELNLWVLSKLLEKSINFRNTTPLIPTLTATISVNVVHAFFIAIVISSQATEMTSYCILAVEFLLNLYSSYKILRLHRKTSPINDTEKRILEKKEETVLLFAIEIMEFLVPLIYIVTFAMAYYGPNADIIGNIKNSDWTYKAVEDVSDFVGDLFMIFFIDFASCIISGLVLWKFADLNFFEECYKMMKVFWPMMSVKMGGKISQVYSNLSLGFEIKFCS
jgi:hypothetical protein